MAKKPTRRGHKTTKTNVRPAITNRRAGFDYELSDDVVVGLMLTGAEVRAARMGRVQLRGAYVTSRENRGRAELYLINASFSLVNNAPKGSGEKAATVDTRSRKILAHRREIDRLVSAKISGQTIVPTKMLTTGRHIKLVIALGRGKKKYDKRETIRQRDSERENAKFLKKL
jgi:SsrA-binding protein